MIDGVQDKANQHREISPGKFDIFRRSYYSSPGIFWQDFRYLLSHRNQLKRASQEEPILPAFRERLMIAVAEEISTDIVGCFIFSRIIKPVSQKRR